MRQLAYQFIGRGTCYVSCVLGWGLKSDMGVDNAKINFSGKSLKTHHLQL